jgi:hypothetical protein
MKIKNRGRCGTEYSGGSRNNQIEFEDKLSSNSIFNSAFKTG